VFLCLCLCAWLCLYVRVPVCVHINKDRQGGGRERENEMERERESLLQCCTSCVCQYPVNVFFMHTCSNIQVLLMWLGAGLYVCIPMHAEWACVLCVFVQVVQAYLGNILVSYAHFLAFYASAFIS
jgi:hypothetical protein